MNLEKTNDIKIEKTGKYFADIEYRKKKYRLNKWGVLCKQSSDNGYWQHAVLDFDSYAHCFEILDTICNLTGAKSYWIGTERAYEFKQ